MFNDLTAQRLIALFAAGWLVLNFPLLGLWDRVASFWGLPVFPLALFGLWAVLIAGIAWLVDRPGHASEDESA